MAANCPLFLHHSVPRAGAVNLAKTCFLACYKYSSLEMATRDAMQRCTSQSVLDNLSLLDAAARGDEAAVRLALESGADVNASDSAGRTTITCAIAGDSWHDVDVSNVSFKPQSRLQILILLLSHDDISLYALNAPVQGVTSLCLAAWLNLPEVVLLLLEDSHGMVAVDGMDTHAATPLMYAARDGRFEVVCHLLEHGARPDFRDVNHRSAIQYSLQHPRILWLCERALRRQRAQESLSHNRRNLIHLPQIYLHPLLASTSSSLYQDFPPVVVSLRDCTRSTETIIQAVKTTDLPLLQTTLFSVNCAPLPNPSEIPILVNLPDALGWSPIHYCVSAEPPSIEVLDVLYRAGADVSLYTTSGHGTPLHCLAYKARASKSEAEAVSMRSFVLHLVRDFRSPLSAEDRNKDTCLHIAAEHGHNLDVLVAFLTCDTNGAVRERRNARGLTALEVAKPEFRAAFGIDAEHLRSVSSASIRTIRPSTAGSLQSTPSLASLASATVRLHMFPERYQAQGPPDSGSEWSTVPDRILNNLRMVSKGLADSSGVDVEASRELLQKTLDMSDELLAYLRSRIHDAADDLRDARGMFKRVDALLEDVTRTMEDSLGVPLVEYDEAQDLWDRARRLTTDSGYSEATAVSIDGFTLINRKCRSMSDLKASGCALTAEVGPVSLQTGPPYPKIVVVQDGTREDCVEQRVTNADHSLPRADAASGEWGLMKLVSPWVKDLPRKISKRDLKVNRMLDRVPSTQQVAERKDSVSSSTAKLKAWLLKKIIRPESPLKLDVASTGDEELSSHVSVVAAPDQHNGSASVVDRSLEAPRNFIPISKRKVVLACRRSLSTVTKDLSRIEECMDAADQYIAMAYHAVSQADQRLKNAVLSRRASLECIRLAQLKARLQDRSSGSYIDASGVDHHQAFVVFPSIYDSSHTDKQTSLELASASSSTVSLSSTLIEGDDNDTRVLRRLLTRKVEARTDGALEEIEKVIVWLRITRDTIQNLRRRT